MQKKPYSAPTVTDHGNAVEKTKGVSGRVWEVTGSQYTTPMYPPPPPGGPGGGGTETGD